MRNWRSWGRPGWRRSIWAIAALSLSLAATAASVARAEDVQTIVKQGMQLRRQGRDQAALAAFQRAARIEDSPAIRAQIALAEQALGLWVEANGHLEQALEHERDSWISKNRKALEGARATIQSHLCRVEIWGVPEGAAIALNGKPAGKLPSLTAWVAPGEVALSATADGFVALEGSVKAPAGGRIREHVELLRAPAPGAPLARRAGVGGGADTALTPHPTAPETTLIDRPKPIADQPASAPAEPGTRWWLWTLVSVGVLAAAGTGGWLLTHRNSCQAPGCVEWQN